MFLQQISTQLAQEASGKLLDYGLAGILIGVILFFTWSLYKTAQSTNEGTQEALRQDIKSLQERMNRYIEEDRQRMMEVIQENTDAFRENAQIFRELLEKQK